MLDVLCYAIESIMWLRDRVSGPDIGAFYSYAYIFGLTTLPPSCADCLEILEPQPPGTPRALQAYSGKVYIHIYIHIYIICITESNI
jgi:hypothetical protein